MDDTPTELEIKQNVWSCDPDRALGYDGFNIIFVKEMWSSIGSYITLFVNKFLIQDNSPFPSTLLGLLLSQKNLTQAPFRIIDLLVWLVVYTKSFPRF